MLNKQLAKLVNLHHHYWYMSSKSQTNQLTDDILNYLLRLSDCFAFRCNTTGLFDTKLGIYRPAPKRGAPDIIAIYKSHFIGIEVKTGKDRLSPAQLSFHVSVQQAHGSILIVKDMITFNTQFETLISHLNAKNL